MKFTHLLWVMIIMDKMFKEGLDKIGMVYNEATMIGKKGKEINIEEEGIMKKMRDDGVGWMEEMSKILEKGFTFEDDIIGDMYEKNFIGK